MTATTVGLQPSTPYPRATGPVARPAPWARSERLALSLVVLGAAVLDGWRLPAGGWMNQYYAAVAQSGAAGWKALLFGSPDLTAITATDKPPVSFWPMAASVRVFGLHPWSIALPQVLETLATVVLLSLTVRILAGRVAALAAATVFALSPVVVALARFDDPDTLLTLLVVAAAYAAVRASRSPRRRWLVLLGALIGLAFLTKWLAALLPVPAFAALVLRPGSPSHRASERATEGRRARTAAALVSGVAAVVALAWVVPVMLTPATVRPYPDTPSGNLLAIILSQDGAGRLVGVARPSALKGLPGVGRLLTTPFAPQVGWLIPAALLALLLAAIPQRRARRSPRLPDGYLVFGLWFVLAFAVFSLMGGAMHPYYTDLLAPAIAGLVGLGTADTWAAVLGGQPRRLRRTGLACVVVGLAAYAAWLLGGYPTLSRWRLPILAAAVIAVLALIADGLRTDRPASPGWRLGTAAGAAAVAVLLGPAVFAAATVSHPLQGANPLAGPAETGAGHAPYSPALLAYLHRHDTGSARWLTAIVTSTAASELQLQSGRPVLTFGGFTGHSGFPTISEVQGWVRRGRLRSIVLAGPYATWRGGRQPAGLVGTPTAAAMAWAGSHGCIVHIPGARYAVLDLGSVCSPSGTRP